jgi:hypothetical protein
MTLRCRLCAAIVSALAIAGCATPSGRAQPTPPMAPAVPAEWLTEKEFGSEELFVGLTDEQRRTVLAVMNRRACDCGCPHGSFARCLLEDPRCPRAPVVLSRAVALAREGKGFDEIVVRADRATSLVG